MSKRAERLDMRTPGDLPPEPMIAREVVFILVGATIAALLSFGDWWGRERTLEVLFEPTPASEWRVLP